MNRAELTRHAVARMVQRSMRDDDLLLIQLIGTEVEDGYLVRNCDCEAAMHALKRLQEQIRRLNGKRSVIASGRVVTVYRARKTTQRKLIRNVGQRDLLA